YVLLMMTIGDDDFAFDLLKRTITEIDEGLSYSPAVPVRKPPAFDGECIISISDYSELTDIDRCVGKRSNEFIYAYPPDIPILSPNEIICQSTVDYIKCALKNGVNIISDSGELPNKILTKQTE
ncbi:MAG: hypothetical protein ACI4IO_04125, partial [Eubacterium sp.]